MPCTGPRSRPLGTDVDPGGTRIDGDDADPPARVALTGLPERVAPTLLGAVLISDVGARVAVRITEVEAYAGIGQDPGSHAHRRRTQRNAAMFGPAGHAYVYFTYGMHWCLNVVAHPEGEAGAVLIRAGEVIEGVEVARTRRPASRADRDLARGPARLAAALGVTGAQDGLDLLDAAGTLRLLASGPPAEPARISSGPRTGISGAGAPTPWRFWLDDDPTVSRHRSTRGQEP